MKQIYLLLILLSCTFSQGKVINPSTLTSEFNPDSGTDIVNIFNSKGKINLSNPKTKKQNKHPSNTIEDNFRNSKFSRNQSETMLSTSAPIIDCINDQTVDTDAGANSYTHSDRNWDPNVTNVPIADFLIKDNWSSSASRGSTSVEDVIIFGEKRLRLAYNGNGVPRFGSYIYSTTAVATETISFDWFLQGCHSFFQSQARYDLWVDSPGNSVEILYNGGGCSFSKSGNTSLSLTAGQKWGITIRGNHFDGSNLLNGRFEIYNFISRNYTLSGATTGTGESLNGVEFNIGTTEVSWIAEDKDGNTSVCSFNITVEDNEDPTITCPDDITTNAMAPVVNFNTPEVTDNVTTTFAPVSPGMIYIGRNGGENFFISDQTFSGSNAFADAVARGGFVATINDAAQNTFIANALLDNGIPEAHIGYSDAISEGTFLWQDGSTSTYENWMPGEPNNTDGGEDYVTISAGGGWNDVGARGTGNARYIFQLDQSEGFLIQTSGLASGSSFPIGVTTNTFEAYDAAENSSSCSFDVTVTDIPSVSTQNIDVDLDNSGNATITAEAIDNGSSAVSGISDLSIDISTFNCSSLGENTVTLTVTSNSGETATGTAVVNVLDVTSPSVSAENITVELNVDGSGTITASDVDNGSSDNCGIDNLALDITTFDCSNLGENTITLTATDASGNQASATAVVTVVDNSAPTLVTQDITVNLDENGTVSIQPIGVLSSVEDNCSSIEDISLSLDEDTFTAEGVYVVNLTSTDASGNSTTVSAEVTVEDTLGVNDIGLDLEVKLYPNPASDNIFFEISNADVQRISIYDINGRLIKTSNALSMNISELSSGVYFTKVEVKNGKAIKVLRFIKK